MAELMKVFKESFPPLRLIGRRYTDADRGSDGGFGHKWNEWFEKGGFEPLDQLGEDQQIGGGYVGCMRYMDGFEYWIGAFFPEGTPVPDGYEYVDIPAAEVGICWIYGSPDGELYGEEVHDMCQAAIDKAGWQIADEPWFFELYNCPRFTTPDQEGKVILDYGVYLKG
ncbi:MAG: GyrI-like domain-containing protein [Firmicutes bacterium]|nr:GyrI-like domain-containing protein [Bacillota bacterium]